MAYVLHPGAIPTSDELNNIPTVSMVASTSHEVVPYKSSKPTVLIIRTSAETDRPCFATEFPLCLANTVNQSEFKKCMEEINHYFSMRYNMWDFISDCSDMIHCIRYESKAEKSLKKINETIERYNEKTFHPVGMHLDYPVPPEMENLTLGPLELRHVVQVSEMETNLSDLNPSSSSI